MARVNSPWAKFRPFFSVSVGLLATVLASASASAQDSLPGSLTNGLIAYYPFNGNAMDQSGNGHDGVVTAATLTTDRFGQNASAYSFNSPQASIDLGDIPAFEFSGDFTISFWIKGGAQQGTVYFLGKYTGYANVGYGIGTGLSNEPYAFLQTHGYPTGAYADGGNQLTDDQWHQLVAVYARGSALSVYVDGALAASTAAIVNVTEILANDDHLLLGQITSGQAFNGKLDDVRIYNRAISTDEIASLFNAESPKLPPLIITPPNSTTVVSLNPATFSVVAEGTQPFSYQWTFGGTNINGATNSQLTIPSVSRANAGTYSVNVCNPYGCTNSTSATLTVTPGPVHVVLGNALVKSPEPVVLPVVLTGNGVENAVSFSLGFDPRLLSFSAASAGPGATNAQVLINASNVANGLVGFAIALPAGATLPEGANELVDITFKSVPLVSSDLTIVSFADSPVKSTVVDANAGTLHAIWEGGTGGEVLIAAADFEGDVSPRPNGDRSLSINDWVEVGRLVAGLDDIGWGTEFQRADCAPLATGGNGVLSVTDWVQAGRFAVGLDPAVPLSGPTNATEVIPGFNHPVVKSGSSCSIQLVRGADPVAGATEVSVSMDSDGNENAVGFSVDFDPAKLLLVSAKSGTNATGATLNINTRHLADGKIGVAIALGTGSAFAVGHLDLFQMRFLSLSNGTDGLPLSFADSPVVREVASPSASTIGATFQDLTLTNAARAFNLQTTIGTASVLQFSWLAEISGAALEVSHVSPSGPWTSVTDVPIVSGGMNTVSIPVNSAPEAVGYYRLRIQ